MESSVQTRTYAVFGMVIACLAAIYPIFIHPFISGIMNPKKNSVHDFDFAPEHGPPGHPRMPRMDRPREAATTTTKSSTLMGVILPIYAVGIVLYLVYTLSKIAFGSKTEGTKLHKREDYLREYYRNFKYDPGKGRFTMGNGNSSSEGESEDDGLRRESRKSNHNPTRGGGMPKDISNCWPKDLAYLLERVNDKDLSDSEISRLKVRLEQTEAEMQRILEAMQNVSQICSQTQQKDDESRIQEVPVEEAEMDELHENDYFDDNYDEVSANAFPQMEQPQKKPQPAAKPTKPAKEAPKNNNAKANTGGGKKNNNKKKSKK